MTLWTAMAAAAAVTAAFVSGKATRDALFLTSLDFSALPTMLMVTSVASILLVLGQARVARAIRPRVLVPASFIASGVLFVAEFLCRGTAPAATAVIVYLHISAAGPLLASGFWLIVSEQFDPRSARRRFGQIAGGGTFGGFLSAIVAERIAAWYGAPAMLLVLAVLQWICAGLIWQLASPTHPRVSPIAARQPDASPIPRPEDFAPSRSAFATILATPYLRHLAALVLFGTTSAALVDYLFKAQAVELFGRGDQLLRFFALYYAATSLLTFLLQTSTSRLVLDRFGIGVSTSTPSWALLAGSLGSLIAPSFSSLVIARGGESVLRSSWFRAGYELFYTPIPNTEKRAAKSLIDVGFDRMGDATGGALVHMVIALLPTLQSPAILSLAAVCSTAAVFAAGRLNRGYLGTLATSLVNRGLPADAPLAKIHRTTRAMGRVVRGIQKAPQPAAAAPRPGLDGELADIAALHARDRGRIVSILSRAEGIPSAFVPHVIPLLGWDAVANHAMFALQKVLEERVGQLEDALIDPNQDFAVRRRLARIFAIGVSARAAAGALLGLDDPRFDVRFQSARSLAAILDRNPRIDLDKERIFDVVLREVAVSRPVWESRRLLDSMGSASPLDAFVRDRAGESLAHVFTLLSLVLPREPLQIAFRSLQTTDHHLRGTALEYLEGVLPPAIRERLWPFLETRPEPRHQRPHQDVINDLLRSNRSVLLNLEELRRRARPASQS